MKKLDPNAPAYPAKINPHSQMDGSSYEPGLTIRQQFAMAAMQGLGAEFQASHSHDLDICERLACRAVRMADALINELNKEVI